jgi:hypothetical protein
MPWSAEVRAPWKRALGLKFLTRSISWKALADELGRYLFFSEFVFDLPEELPKLLENVPRAPAEARLLVEDLCDQLCNDRRSQALCIERAKGIEQELNLPAPEVQSKILAFEIPSHSKNAPFTLRRLMRCRAITIFLTHK